MPTYCAYALTIDTPFEVPELQPVRLHPPARPDIVISLGEGAPPAPNPTADETVATVAGMPMVFRQGGQVIVYPKENADPAQLAALLVGRALSNAFRQRGWLPLHASAVVLEGIDGVARTVLFVGESGAGKSTTAAAFHARGHRVIADDLAVLQQVGSKCVVRPAWSRVRLNPDSLAVLGQEELPSVFHIDKQSVELGPGRLRRLFAVDRIYVLHYGHGLESARLPAADAARVLDQFSFPRKRHGLPDTVLSGIRLSAGVAAKVQVCNLTRQRSLDALAEVVTFVEEELKLHA